MPTDGISAWPSIQPPVITAPKPGPVNGLLGFQIDVAPYVSATGSHSATDWEIRTGPDGTGVVQWSSTNDLFSKLFKIVPGLNLQLGKTYYIRARFISSTATGPWSADVVITT